MDKNYLNQCWNIVNWTIGNKLQWNFNRYSNIFIQENAFENVVCKMVAIFSRPQCVNHISVMKMRRCVPGETIFTRYPYSRNTAIFYKTILFHHNTTYGIAIVFNQTFKRIRNIVQNMHLSFQHRDLTMRCFVCICRKLKLFFFHGIRLWLEMVIIWVAIHTFISHMSILS